MDSNEIKRANRKALPKFILFVAILLFAGFAIGFLDGKFSFGSLTGALKRAGAFFSIYIAPWMTAGIAIIMPIICIPLYRSAKKQIDAWDGEEEETYLIIDRKLSIAIWISSASLILSYFLMAASYSGWTDFFESWYMTALPLIAVAAVVTVIIEVLIIGQKCVDSAKRMNPEKKASFYDMKFQRKWMEDCDEAEKIIIGKCAFKAYTATNRVCAISAGVLAVCALIFGIGFLPSLMVCLVWIVNQSVYCKEALRYSKAGNKIS